MGMREWWETPGVALAFIFIGLGGGGLLTYLSPLIGFPVCVSLIALGIFLFIQAYRRKRRDEARNTVETKNKLRQIHEYIADKKKEFEQRPIQIDTASQMYDRSMGEHITKVKGVLEIWEQQLSEMIKQGEIVELRTPTEIETAGKNDFWYLLMHCPSLDRKYEDLLGQREIYTMHLNPVIERKGKTIKIKPKKKDVIEQRKYLNEAMQSFVGAIGYSLSSYEYTRYKCPLCPHNMTKS
jgi:hypothetical protein